MHILFLSDNFPPEVNAPATRTYEHAREWVRLGHRVTVVTCAPNFPQGRVFPGYRNRPLQRETLDGIEVLRVWSFIARNEGFVKRTLDYASYMVSATLASPLVRDVDVIVGTSPQFFTACAAAMVARLKRRPWVFEVRDLWPATIRAVGAVRAPRMLDGLEKLELFLYRQADAIISVTHSFREDLTRRGIDPRKIEVVMNGVDLHRFAPRPKDPELLARWGLEDAFVVGYIGTHGLCQGLDVILDAAQRLPGPIDGQRVKFLFVGDGAEKPRLVDRARREQLDHVVFVDPVPKDEVVRYWSLLDAAIVPLRKDPLFTTVIPSKLFECMAMGVPIVHAVAGESASLVEREGVGLVVEPENPTALVAAIRRLQTDVALREAMRRRGPIAARAYDRRALAHRMLEVLERLARQDAFAGPPRSSNATFRVS